MRQEKITHWRENVKRNRERRDSLDRARLEQLLSGVAAGEREAMAQLYDSTRGAMYAMALSLLKNPEDAQDVTQDAFMRVWESAHLYQAKGSPMAWLLTITRNLALMRLRQGARQVDLDDGAWEAIPAEMSDISPEDRHLLQTAMAALTDEERRVVLLHAVTGLKHREIAALLELPLATVLSKYHRAIKKLKRQLEGDDGP
jgi:RNA polymerase sigma-70 factor (ECF subfamily)